MVGTRFGGFFAFLWISGTLAGEQPIFDSSYPKHLVSKKLAPGEFINVDGKLNEKAWESISWYSHFVDITNHDDSAENAVPETFQASVGIRWDAKFLYVGARVNEPFIRGVITGHNEQAPYHDNDFEVFIDVSGTTEYYKEFEMNVKNATYDVNWGVPDQDGLSCDKSSNRAKKYLPVCVNTSFPGYDGNWTMVSLGNRTNGLHSATFASNQSKYVEGNSWTLEIAFPIRKGVDHGGLLDTDLDSNEYNRYNPNEAVKNARRGTTEATRRFPRYWWIDFARAEHPRQYLNRKTGAVQYCPFNCSESLSGYVPSLENPNATECAALQSRYQTLLGSNPVYGCYFEWVLQDLGVNAYMHRPQEWAILQFQDDGESEQPCRNIEFYGRHAVKMIYTAQSSFKSIHETFANNTKVLMNEAYCKLPACNLSDFLLVANRQDIFTGTSIAVINNASALSRQCTSRPCYTASVEVTVPRSDGYKYRVTINENMLIQVHHIEQDFNDRSGANGLLCF
jgi:hypothetical protein